MRLIAFPADAPNWRARMFGARGYAAGPRPPELQTDLPTDNTVTFRAASGVPQPAVTTRAYRVANEQQLTTPVPNTPPQAIAHQQECSTFGIGVAPGSTKILPFEERRCYLLIVNVGAIDAVVSFQTNANDIAIPLLAGGGALELIYGTVSDVYAGSLVAGFAATLSVTEGLRFPEPGAPRSKQWRASMDANAVRGMQHGLDDRARSGYSTTVFSYD